MRVKGDGIFSINTSASGGFGNAGISLPEIVPDEGGGVDMPPITTDLLVYYNPDVEVYSDDGSTLAEDGDNIRQFNDQSGNSNTLNQSTGSSQPLYDTSEFGNGNAAIYSINDSLNLTSVLDFNNSTDMSFYLVLKKANTVSTTSNWFKGAVTYPRTEFRSTKITARSDSSSNRDVSYTDDGTLKVITIIVNRTEDTWKLYVNGQYIGASWNTVSNYPLTIAMLFANTTYGIWSGNTLFYTSAHDATQVAEVSDWLNTKYSIY